MIKFPYTHTFGKGIRGKLILVFLLVGLLPLILAATSGIPYFSKVLTNSIGDKFQHIAVQMSNRLNAILWMEVEEARRLGTTRITIRQEIEQADGRYSGKSDPEITAERKQMDALWADASEGDDLVKPYFENKLAHRLKLHQTFHPEEYMQIMATDSRGALLAATDKPSDYYHGDKLWWRKAFNGGRGATFVSTLHLSENSGLYILDIAIPVMDELDQHAVGVIKVGLNAAEVFKNILDLQVGEIGHAHLVDSIGNILIEGKKDNSVCAFATGKLPPRSAANMLQQNPSWYLGLCEHCGEQVVSASAPLNITGQMGPDSFGGTHWYVLVHEGKSGALAVLNRLVTILIFATIGAVAIIVFISIKLTGRIVHPVHVLQEGAKIIGSGDLDHRLDIRTGDEIEQLAAAFNEMSDKLRNSYQSLEKKVAGRTSKLRETQQLLDMILDKTNTGLDIIDSRYNIKYINESWKKIYGDPAGRKCYEYFMGKDTPCRGCGISRSLATGNPVITEEYLPKEKQYRQVTTVPHKTENGEMLFAEVNVDITDRVRVEEELRAAKDEVDQIFHTAADGMRIIDKNFTILRTNETFASMVGIPREDIVGCKCYDIFKGSSCHTPNCSMQAIMSGQESLETESLRTRPDGKEIPCIIAAHPFKATDGTVIGIVEDFKDISERHILEAQIRQAQKMESVGTLAGGIAHDFNNLLGGILGYLSIMKTSLDPADRNYRYVELIEKAGKRAATLTNQLLAFSRKGKYEISAVNINNSIHNVLDILESTINKNIETSCSLDDNIPRIKGDATQIEQIIMNLCVNAADAMPDGGRLKIKTEAALLDAIFCADHPGAEPGNYVHIILADTGEGMDNETISRIFEPFFTTKGQEKGTGLGLSMVYGIVKNHGGYVNVYSEPGKGSIFHLYFPPITEGAVKEKEKTSVESATGGQETILIVDDEEIIRTMLQEVLESLGYTILLAIDGADAIQVYSQRHDDIDLVIIDMIMPKMGGKETCHELKKINPSIKVILASGFSQDKVIREVVSACVNGFIQKPFTIRELSKKIREVLNG